jgi:hypothetical protein
VRLTGLTVAAMGLSAIACTRDPLGECPAIGPGELVITEFRGPQNPEDSLGPWVEMHNTSSATLDLQALKIRFRKVDGSGEVSVLVRRSVSVAPGGYVVLGLVPDNDRPAHIDYGFGADFRQTFLASAAVDIESCGERIDRARYENLPKTGTYSFGGTPSADNNDVLTMWCPNPTSTGTPQQANPPCP